MKQVIKDPLPAASGTMDIRSLDNYVWENYNELTIKSFADWLSDKYTISGWVWMHSLRDHAKAKEEEHRRTYAKLCLFRDSLPPPLRDRVDPFIKQQERIYNAYQNIHLYFAIRS